MFVSRAHLLLERQVPPFRSSHRTNTPYRDGVDRTIAM
ncbi:hypothetical protein MM1S1540310_1055 [Mycobacteroides abscessus subsp. bolletii 1S-154-0310]|uniref:Uncharacterized protein n=3 Tax=Mycobacteroides abscessus TaxID=36809 RepID=A0A829MEC3_9MYCO|nr:hypothetical protein MA5S0304_0534 [Mycobacteroides abscessus 5S-0304]EIU17540.1 hypothetical protein MA5S0421_0789 [Mycobacteroides abscessus 5S-0421]EIU18485.1 hypothetical protein MA5S0422_1520 [Mycobacteroides abscessus 5S-0422]EIU28250.1 hypothetical protein MA5S0708_1014 [Mycobacteroides abscessus 5S-0708]EIU33238.1 hypothetical protein MA5S0817_0566 [Mycobacteroides abscessus 5S-0817]EIU34988.1 hypothetical protein MA5S1212_0956 [Mycobacteroides abscessus 5S-1212]EIU45051.1 hypothet